MTTELPSVCHTVAMFLRALGVLALPAAKQLEWLRSLGLGEPAVCDELADEYYQQWLMLPQLVDAGLIPAAAVDGLNGLNDLLAELVAPGSELATIDALQTSPRWDLVREAAGSCVVMLK